MELLSAYRKKTRLYKVYHIHAVGDNDTSKGYIGITRRSLSYRLGQHRHSKRPIGVTLRTGISVEITQIGDMMPKEDALYLEGVLRPAMNIGWNCMAGGNRCNQLWRNVCVTGIITTFCVGHEPHNSGKGERYELTDPEGVKHIPEIFTRFCRDNGLQPQNIRKVAKGIRKHSCGWTAIKLG